VNPAGKRTRTAPMATTGAHSPQVPHLKRLPLEPNPVLVEHARQRAESAQNRVADRITTFAGSMAFVYISILWFGCWIGFGVEKYPYGLLTMIVSLEAIFLSTFVMISQNRADAKRQVLADHQWEFVQAEEGQNEQLLALSNQILDLTKAIHGIAASLAVPQPDAEADRPGEASASPSGGPTPAT
jgi:uncharacterized membrane protein